MTPADHSREEEELERLRRMSPSEHLAVAMRLSQERIDASKAEIRKAHPEFTKEEVNAMFVEIHYGKELAEGFREHQRKRREQQS